MSPRSWHLLAAAALAALSACGEPVASSTAPDTGFDAGASGTGLADAGPRPADAGRPDASPFADAGAPDAAPDVDADAGTPDAAPAADAATPCSGVGGSCPAPGVSQCAGDEIQVCELREGCLVWSSPTSCRAGEVCALDGCRDCRTGSFPGLTLEVDGETRTYFLHVPASYSCDRPLPALIDFHGTAGAPAPEEAYGLADATALADREGLLLVRPRSRSSLEGGYEIYRWDQNPGDLGRNARFARALVAEVSRRLPVDPQRVYASGFSSGTNMSSQFLGERTFAGIAGIGGGVWNPPALPSFDADAPRLYLVTGFRDYMYSSVRTLLSLLEAAAYPTERLFLRENTAGHELYGWHYRELWDWLDRGARPAPGTLSAAWTRETLPAAETLLALAAHTDGTVVASGDGGAFWRRSPEGAWTSAGRVGIAAYVGLCLLPSGAGLAVGEGRVAVSADAGASWVRAAPVPEFFGAWFGPSWLNTIACAGGSRVVGGGYWNGVQSDDGGRTWAGYALPTPWGGTAQIASMRIGPSGTAVAGGYYDYLARSVAGADFQQVAKDDSAGWYNGVAAAPGGHWWAVGEAGAILHSADDGASWTSQRLAGGEDLYAVAFWDAQVGVAVGLHGWAATTRDGGATWAPAPTGLDAFLSDVVLLDAHTALAVGEGGLALRLSF